MDDPVKFAAELIRLQLSATESSRDNASLALQPHIEILRMSFEASTKFADQAIKSGFILNGGALVLFSGFAAFFKINPTLVATELVLAALFFIGGLVASCFTSFFAYRSATAGVTVAVHRIAHLTLTHLKSDNPENKKQLDTASTWSSLATRNARWAIFFGLLGLIAFVLGVLVGGWTLMANVGGA